MPQQLSYPSRKKAGSVMTLPDTYQKYNDWSANVVNFLPLNEAIEHIRHSPQNIHISEELSYYQII